MGSGSEPVETDTESVNAASAGAGVDEPDEPFSVDDLLPVWTEDDVARLARWKQGDLIGDVGVSWLGPDYDDDVTRVPAGEWDWAPVAAPELRTPFAVIASQTCDIGADGPGRKHPFVDVHPVIDLSSLDLGRQKQIRQFGFRYLVALTEASLPEGFWVADLRLTMSISKAKLLAETPISGFAVERDRLDFAAVLAEKRRRPALHEVLSEELVDRIETHIASKDSAEVPPDWHQCVEQVRLDIQGDRLGPEMVSVFIVYDDFMAAEHRAIWRELTGAIEKTLKRAGLRYGVMTFASPDEMTARRYRDSVPIPVRQLRRAPAW